ncbi:MAG: DNA adenine methylase, partial [Peptococcaceae bacterium]|nr:DNA adenine methylase [Peptococcaceae bacterium]
MRFIGNKTNLLKNIDRVISENTTGNEKIFCDIFSGTGSVARYFKPRYEVHSNDALHFSYVIQKATVENNSKPVFSKLKAMGIEDPFKFLEETQIEILDYNDDRYFITKNYTPHDDCERMYVSNKNALRIDFIRNTIELWKKENLITELEYYYLLAGLIEGVPYISNITGTYGAYLKHWDKRTFKDLEMARLDVIDNKRNNKSYNVDANKLIEEIDGDILYLDPPYNSRQYAPNYHLLEMISKYDYPKIYGVTGMRPYYDLKSPFCVRNEVCEAFEDLISKAKFSNIVMSYSSDGLMNCSEIEKILKKYGI